MKTRTMLAGRAFRGPISASQFRSESVERYWKIGIRFIIAGLVIIFITGMRRLLLVWGIPISTRWVSMIGSAMGFLCYEFGAYFCTKCAQRRLTDASYFKVVAWRVVLCVALVYGFVRGNRFSDIGNEFIMLWIMSSTLILGTFDRFWYSIEKTFTVLFYAAVALILFYYTTPAPQMTEDGVVDSVDYMDFRYISSVGMDFRIYTAVGSFLGVWAMVRSNKNSWDRWRVAQVLAFVLEPAMQVGIFKFRGALISFSLLILALLILRPMLERRGRPETVALILLLIVCSFFGFRSSEVETVMVDRFREQRGTDEESIFGSRNIELQLYLHDMGPALIFGRGLGGSYDAFEMFRMESAKTWTTIHYGLLVFDLKGGVIFLGLFLSIMLPSMIPREPGWYANPCNITATLVTPMLLFNFVLGPFALTPGAVLTYVPAFMILSRFARVRDFVTA